MSVGQIFLCPLYLRVHTFGWTMAEGRCQTECKRENAYHMLKTLFIGFTILKDQARRYKTSVLSQTQNKVQ